MILYILIGAVAGWFANQEYTKIINKRNKDLKEMEEFKRWKKNKK